MQKQTSTFTKMVENSYFKLIKDSINANLEPRKMIGSISFCARILLIGLFKCHAAQEKSGYTEVNFLRSFTKTI